MKIHYILGLLLLVSCQEKESAMAQNEAAGDSIAIFDNIYQDHRGIDCDLPDTLRTNCADINFVFPEIKTGNKALKRSVANWTNYFLSSVLLYTDDSTTIAGSTLNQAVREFYNNHETYKGSAVYGAFTAKSHYKVLYNEGDHLTLEINGYSYQGGAHSSTTIAVASFNKKNGEQLSWEDIVTDKKAFAALVEKKIKKVRADVFDDGFKFDDIFKFTLPKNYGLTKEGIYMHYEEYEIFPYAYGNTVITIPFNELGTLLKIK